MAAMIVSAVATMVEVSTTLSSLFHPISYLHPGERPGFSREEVPLPTQPPYTAFIGNLAFDLTDEDIGAHFSEFKVRRIRTRAADAPLTYLSRSTRLRSSRTGTIGRRDLVISNSRLWMD